VALGFSSGDPAFAKVTMLIPKTIGVFSGTAFAKFHTYKCGHSKFKPATSKLMSSLTKQPSNKLSSSPAKLTSISQGLLLLQKSLLLLQGIKMLMQIIITTVIKSLPNLQHFPCKTIMISIIMVNITKMMIAIGDIITQNMLHITRKLFDITKTIAMIQLCTIHLLHSTIIIFTRNDIHKTIGAMKIVPSSPEKEQLFS